MLTIICFLYAQPKYTLPDNRVEFYRECCRALLEKWDLAKLADRANQFETDHKMDILGRIAFQHITDGNTTDEEISAKEIREISRAGLRALSINPSFEDKIVREIVDNSGLLVELPPDGFRFPHRTFLEFFAALHLHDQENVGRVLGLYHADEARWRPTILMYMGLCKKRDDAAILLASLRDDFVATQANADGLNVTVFSALIESSFAEPEIAYDVLNLADQYLTKGNFSAKLVDELGYVAANTRWTYSEAARVAIKGLLGARLDRERRRVVISAALRCRTDVEIRAMVGTQIGSLDLVEFFIEAGQQQAAYYLHRLLDLGIDREQKRKLVLGLAQGNHFELLLNILIEGQDDELRSLSADALYSASAGSNILKILDSYQFRQPNLSVLACLEQLWSTFGWSLQLPKNAIGQMISLGIGHYGTLRHQMPSISYEIAGGMHRAGAAEWLNFVTYLVKSSDAASPSEERFETPARVLKRYWARLPSTLRKISSWPAFAVELPDVVVYTLCAFSGFCGLALVWSLIGTNLAILLFILSFILFMPLVERNIREGDGDALFIFLAPLCYLLILAAGVRIDGRSRRLRINVGWTQYAPDPIWYAAEIFQCVLFALTVFSCYLAWRYGLYLLVTFILCNVLVTEIWIEGRFIVSVSVFGAKRNKMLAFRISESQTARGLRQ